MTTSPGRAFDPDDLRAKYLRERDKRLRADGNDQYVEVKGRFAHFLEDPYARPGSTRAPLSSVRLHRGRAAAHRERFPDS
jgi:hypothetical protein